ncbi:MAG: hypothetical protein V3U27_10550, partial [Candidatus Tectomicrobia bacterium]
FSLVRGTQLARRGHRLIERRRGAQKRVWSAYPRKPYTGKPQTRRASMRVLKTPDRRPFVAANVPFMSGPSRLAMADQKQ